MEKPQTKKEYIESIMEMLQETNDVTKVVYIYKLLEKTRETQGA